MVCQPHGIPYPDLGAVSPDLGALLSPMARAVLSDTVSTVGVGGREVTTYGGGTAAPWPGCY